jgi:DNA-binding LacI/PurR family transcriptional regulator
MLGKSGRREEAAIPDQRRRVTSVQVAQLSGVSRTTVSYVLNGTPNQTISAQTRRRVLDAAEALGYTPSAATWSCC